MVVIVFCQALCGQAADYFVNAESGHDDNSGLSPAEAWQSIERVNQTRLSAGDTVHLKAGSVWRESLMCQSGVEGRPVTYTSYGEGPKPTLLASVDLCSPDTWVPDGPNVWATRRDRITGNEPIPSFASKDWSLYCDGEGEASMTTGTGHQGSTVYTLRCRKPGERPTNIQLNCVGIALEPGQCIRYRFRAKATHPFSITDIALIQANHPWGSYGVTCQRATDITTDWQEHEVVIRTTMATPVTDGRLSFFIGSSITQGSEFSFIPLGAELVHCDSLGLDADVGNIILVPKAGLQKIAAWKRWDRANLTRQGDFFHDPADNRLYFYSERHPAELYSQIEAAMKRVIVRFQDSTYVTVDGLTIAYTGAHGANGSYCKHGIIRNCEFLWIGGSHLFTQIRRSILPKSYRPGPSHHPWQPC
jgi:hypothetical protein